MKEFSYESHEWCGKCLFFILSCFNVVHEFSFLFFSVVFQLRFRWLLMLFRNIELQSRSCIFVLRLCSSTDPNHSFRSHVCVPHWITLLSISFMCACPIDKVFLSRHRIGLSWLKPPRMAEDTCCLMFWGFREQKCRCVDWFRYSS